MGKVTKKSLASPKPKIITTKERCDADNIRNYFVTNQIGCNQLFNDNVWSWQGYEYGEELPVEMSDTDNGFVTQLMVMREHWQREEIYLCLLHWAELRKNKTLMIQTARKNMKGRWKHMPLEGVQRLAFLLGRPVSSVTYLLREFRDLELGLEFQKHARMQGIVKKKCWHALFGEQDKEEVRDTVNHMTFKKLPWQNDCPIKL